MPPVERPKEATFVPDTPDAFRAGVRVRHPTWGEGRVLSCTGRPPRLAILIRFDHSGVHSVQAAEGVLEILLD